MAHLATRWKQIPVNLKLAASGEFHGFAGIEELTNYEITKPDRRGELVTKQFCVKKKKVKKKRKDFSKDINAGVLKIKQEEPSDEEWNNDVAVRRQAISPSVKRKKSQSKNARKKLAVSKESAEEILDADDAPNEIKEVDTSAWDNLFVPDPVLRALGELGFTAPTPIQALTLPSAIRDRMDVFGSAETGSGKTLAFGIPVIHRILRAKEEMAEVSDDKPLFALILTPTRELAIQIKDHLEAAAKYTGIKVVVVVGGMAPQKQERLLKRRPDIVVATPGRLWELIQEGNAHLDQLDSLKCLVIDEADRMAEKGHFEELSEILSLANSNEEKTCKRQNFVFSATLTMLHDIPKRLVMKKKKYKITQDAKIDSIAALVGMKEKRKVFDLSRKAGTVETLTEAKLDCTPDEKDSYLYYFLCMYPGRTLVFANSIECIRRLKNVFELLECRPLPLHSSMHQRQRLKNLDRFRLDERGLLLASDVAARGLDIPGVQHVIQYEVPRTAESYVHRSGRTARAQKEGLNLTLIDPRDGAVYRKLCRTLNREKPLPTFPVDREIFRAVHRRVEKARELDKMEYQKKKTATQKNWLLNAAEKLDVDIDDRDLLQQIHTKDQETGLTRKIKTLRKELHALLQKQITPRGFFSNYPTKSGGLKPLVIQGSGNALSAVRKEQGEQKSLILEQKRRKLKRKKKKFVK